MRRFNGILKARIYEAGLRQMEVADRVGISETALSLIVTGRRNANEKVKAKIAEVLGAEVEELFGENAVLA